MAEGVNGAWNMGEGSTHQLGKKALLLTSGPHVRSLSLVPGHPLDKPPAFICSPLAWPPPSDFLSTPPQQAFP